jgi:hypothetical protein
VPPHMMVEDTPTPPGCRGGWLHLAVLNHHTRDHDLRASASSLRRPIRGRGRQARRRRQHGVAALAQPRDQQKFNPRRVTGRFCDTNGRAAAPCAALAGDRRPPTGKGHLRCPDMNCFWPGSLPPRR